MAEEHNIIPFDRMKEQIEKEVSSLICMKKNTTAMPPKISFEKGVASVSFQVPPLNERNILSVLALMKNHLENVRVHSFGEGYYAFQALNRNLFQSDNIFDNFKAEMSGLTTNFRVDLTKKGLFVQEEISLALEVYKYFFSADSEDPATALSRLGASVYHDNEGSSWSHIAGYEEVKKQIRESVIFPLKNPALYDGIAKLTRKNFESNRPKAILFEGPPGVGKTTAARIIAGDVKIPLVYLPIESIMSKWYGQSSQNLSKIFDYCEELGSCILFLDEIDSLAGSRDQQMFEATRRILSVLLRKLDGIEAVSNTIMIGATNRKSDLDPALISRFDQTIMFPLPKAFERAAIFSNYARHLANDDLSLLGEKSEGFSGRNIKDVCEYTERRWARRLIIKGEDASAPSAEYYRYSISLWNGEAEGDNA